MKVELPRGMVKDILRSCLTDAATALENDEVAKVHRKLRAATECARALKEARSDA